MIEHYVVARSIFEDVQAHGPKFARVNKASIYFSIVKLRLTYTEPPKT